MNGRRDIRRVLLVDDDPAVVQGLQQLLERAGCRVVTAQDHDGATHLIRAQPFDLLITDLNLPDGNGLDLVALVKEVRPSTAVVLMTGYGCSAVRHQAEEWRLSGYLEKPIDVEVLLRLIDTLPAAGKPIPRP